VVIDAVVVGRVGRVEFRLIPAAGLLIARDVGTHRDLGMEIVRERVSRGLLRGVSGVRVDPEEAAPICGFANALLHMRRDGEEERAAPQICGSGRAV